MEENVSKVTKGAVIAEGKTKVCHSVQEDPDLLVIENKNDITKNDDESQTKQMDSKAKHATTTTSIVFELLKHAGIPVAYKRQLSETEFLAERCNMIPLEVVIRRYAVGSYLKRYPNFKKKEGEVPHRFHSLAFELFLKTTGGKILSMNGDVRGETPNDSENGRPIDDPFICNPDSSVWDLRHPKVPGWDARSDLGCPVFRAEILPKNVTVEMIEEIARKVFLLLEGAWAQRGCRLIDFKIELGINSKGELVVADVIDNDSWRLRTIDWKELSKQLFRDNFDMEEIADKYALVAALVERFAVPEQAIILWRGSESDKFPEIPEIAGVQGVEITKSGHKAPSACMEILEDLLAAYPQGGVILSLVGMSNGLGPTLAARTSFPVIAVALTSKERPHDVWSSLETPSNVPLLTTLSPKNAVLAALNILAQKNPVAYMHRQYVIEGLDV
jgi:phosphoribosylaminoimidazole carboxylase/phosphoribosylaminoimidazole-succinocarboxamide synthase